MPGFISDLARRLSRAGDHQFGLGEVEALIAAIADDQHLLPDLAEAARQLGRWAVIDLAD